ncbi:MAG TPA: gluconate 2-dehydrogenase subunit 3 family protein [Kofleriaceae bacterium]|nr:gluconate 2-dehydrogenase subunit 3 family protein [Kofleriaceae bacterium]
MITRRRFVKLVGGAAALATVPLPGCLGDDQKLPRGVFFDEHQWATIDLATDLIVPSAPDHMGARDALAVRYIDQLLSAFEQFPSPPKVFGGGPYSGRQPFPDGAGNPGDPVGDDNFREFVPLSRVKAIAWQMRVYGSAATTGGTFNDALLGPTLGYQDLYTEGIFQLDQLAAQLEPHAPPFRLVSADNRRLALDMVAQSYPGFYQALLEHTLEGMFGAPEYGGNAKLVGWTLTQFDGDSAPLGHAFYDTATGAYIDRADQPTASPSPGAVSEDFDDDILQLLEVAALGSGGMRFF